MTQGYLALVLHAHLPFVRHPESDDVLEEDWLYEAITETYLPLLNAFDKLVEDGVPFRVTMTVSPTLCAMLSDPLLMQRYRAHLAKLLELAAKEESRTYGDWQFHFTAKTYHDRLRHFRWLFEDNYNADLIAALRRLQNIGVLEIITCAATHAFLPHYESMPQAIRAQLATAVEDYRRHFHRDPRGIWLPECGYFPGLDELLREFNLRYFFTDSHGVVNATPRPRYGVYAPIYCPTGVATFARDQETSRQVWSSEAGYPGDPDYREFYRDIGYDLPIDIVGDYVQSNGLRKFTGLKYHRITGKVDLADKQPYVREQALSRAGLHSGDFVWNRGRQIRHLADVMGRPPIIVAPYDAELFGHWWFEGPEFLDYVIRKATYDQKVFALTTPGEYLEHHPEQQVAVPAYSSWGRNGYAEMWLDGINDWIYPHIFGITRRMIALARRFDAPNDNERRALNQAAREVMLAQSSDWPFIIKTGTMVPYAERRLREHVARFNELHDMLNRGTIDMALVEAAETQNNLFAHADYRTYR